MDPNSPTRYRLAVWYAIGGDKRFLAHRDTLRFWQRALIRADIPVVYSQGFNPHIRMSLPLPRSVGTAGACELMLVEARHQADLAGWSAAIAAVLPQDIDLLGLQWVPYRLDVQPLWARYRVDWDAPPPASLAERVQAFHRAGQWLLERPARRRHPARSIDLKTQVLQLDLQGASLTCQIRLGQAATVRVDELLTALDADRDSDPVLIERTAVAWPPPLDTFKPAAPITARPIEDNADPMTATQNNSTN